MNKHKLLELAGIDPIREAADILVQDRSKIGCLAQQLASAALAEFGPAKAKAAAEKGANRIYSILLKGIDDYLKSARMKKVNEMVEVGDDIKVIVNKIFKLAEEQAFDDSSESKSNVTGDQVFKNGEDLLKVIKDGLSEKVRKEYS